MSEELNGYQLSRQWFDFAFENPEKVNPNHAAMYFYAIEHCNKLGWKKKFGFPASLVMSAMGIKSYHTYKKTLDDLVKWGFFKMVQRSKNQYTANIIALVKNNKAQYKALDKATQMHSEKQTQSNDSINKPLNKETNKPENKGARVLEVPVPEQLQIEGFEERFLAYWEYMKESYHKEPNLQAVQANFRKLLELKLQGNDPLKVIDQTMNAGNKSFYPLKDKEFESKSDNNGNGRKTRGDRQAEQYF